MEKTIGEVKEHLGKWFTDYDEVIESLYLAHEVKENVILYGPSSMGKSFIIREYADFMEVPMNKVVCHSEMTVDSLLGVPDMAQLLTNSTYEIAFEKTVFAQEGILVLEEALDAPLEVLSCLKDVISSRGLYIGGKFKPIQCDFIVMLTNREPSEVGLDESTSAFLRGRFSFCKRVAWKDYSYDRYFKLIRGHYPDESEDFAKLVAQICAEHAESSIANVIMPRQALVLAKVLTIDDRYMLRNLSFIEPLIWDKYNILPSNKSMKEIKESINNE